MTDPYAAPGLLLNATDVDESHTIVSYQAPATNGMSGGPVFMKKDNKDVVIGIHHTHKYQGSKAIGVLFTKPVLEFMKEAKSCFDSGNYHKKIDMETLRNTSQ